MESNEGHLELGLMDAEHMTATSVTVVDANSFEYTFEVASGALPIENHYEVVSEIHGSGTHHGATLCVVSNNVCLPDDEEMQQIAITFEPEQHESIEIPSLEDNGDQVSGAGVETGSQRKRERSKRPIPVPSQWKRNTNKARRMKGQSYMGYQSVIEKEGDKERLKFTEAQARNPRILGAPCTKHFSTSKKGYQCHMLTQAEREALFNNFWNSLDWGQKRLYVSLHVEVDETKKKTTKSQQSRRGESFRYFIRKNSAETIRVCKLMFLSTFGLGTGMVRYWVKNNNFSDPLEASPKPKPSQSQGSQDQACSRVSDDDYVYQFFESLPKFDPNHSKVPTTKLCLEPILSSKKQVFNLYQSKCSEMNIKPVTRAAFQGVFNRYNLTILPTKWNACSTCTLYKNGKLDDEVGRNHLKNEDRLRKEKESDKSLASKNKVHVIAIDVEPVRQAPFVQGRADSELCLKSKLNVYSVIVHDLKSDTATCMWWNESNGDLNSSTYTSCIIYYLETKFSDKLPVVIYSDGDVPLNRNTIFSNALLDFASRNGKPISQKYYEKGHSKSECDTIHKSIDRVLKHMDIHLPSDYEKAFKFARKKPNPYTVWNMTYEFFKDYAYKDLERYESIDIFDNQTEIEAFRAVKYDSSGTMYFKIFLNDEWTIFPQVPKQVPTDQVYPMLYSGPLKLSEEKWQHLQQLKVFLPSDCHSFYDFLPH